MASGKILVGLGLGFVDLAEASVESQLAPSEPSPAPGEHGLISVDEFIAEGEVALPPISDFYRQVQESLNFEPSGVQKTIALDASQLERQSALYNLEHSNLLPDNIFSHSPLIQLEQRSEIERQQLANLFKKKTRPYSKLSSRFGKSPRNISNPSSSNPTSSMKLSPRRISSVKRSYQALKKLGLERLAVFQPDSGRDDLDVTSPTVTSQNDPRSPSLSTSKNAFLSFMSLQPSGSVPRTNDPKSEVTSKANKKMSIGLGLPSRVSFRRKLARQGLLSRGSVDSTRSQSRRLSKAYQNLCVVVTEPSFTSPQMSTVESPEGSNRFLKPSNFTPRSLYDIIEVLTPPSSTSSSPRSTPSPRNQWSSPFVRVNAPQKRKRASRTQLSPTPSTDSPPMISSVVETANVDPKPAEVPTPALVLSARPAFKRLISKFTSGLFKLKRSRSSKTSDLTSPVLIENANAPSDTTKVSGGSDKIVTLSCQNLQYLF